MVLWVMTYTRLPMDFFAIAVAFIPFRSSAILVQFAEAEWLEEALNGALVVCVWDGIRLRRAI